MTVQRGSVGRTDFVERFGLWSDEQAEAAKRMTKTIDEHGLEIVRFVFPDQHGILRGKAILADSVGQALANGVTMTTTLLVKDTSHRTVFPVWTSGAGIDMEEMVGAGDFMLVADPATFKVLPWAPDTGWVLCDIYFQTGAPVPFATRNMMRTALSDLAGRGFDYVSGFECEFHVFRMDDPKMEPEHGTQPATPPDVSLLWHGFNYLTEIRQDEMEGPLALIRRTLVALDLPLRSVEVEFGPSQCEVTFHPGNGLQTPDMVVLFRSAVKQICRRNGYHATFMCKPALPNIFSSGWHLHQSLVSRENGANAFMPKTENEPLSTLGQHFLAGLIEHALPASAFSTPTINGYKRFRPHTLAPDRVAWGRDNKGTMLRVLGRPDDPASRIENRVGDPAANPYLYLTSQILCGLDGIDRKLTLPAATDTPYEADAPMLPASLIDSVAALKQSDFFRGELGDLVVDWFVTIKEAEIARFLSEVTDWEQREYFEIF